MTHTDEWFKSVTPDRALSIGHVTVTEVWKQSNLRLRVAGHADGTWYVGPYDFYTFHKQYLQHRIGPYATREEAQLAAEMLGEIVGGPWGFHGYST